MSSASKNISGIIFAAVPRADRYTRWEVLSASEGFVPVMAPAKLAMPFGLFDAVELVASARGKNLFLQEAHLLRRPNSLAENLPAFTEAARLANLVRAAFRQMPDYAPIFAIFEKALEHYSPPKKTDHGEGKNNTGLTLCDPFSPALVTLKAFYKMLAEEGFAVAQDWLWNLPRADGEAARTLLLAEVSSRVEAVVVEKALRSLIVWAERELGFRS